VQLNQAEIKKQKDPLQIVAKKIANQYDLICFDEFHVSDIADAMILHRLLQFFTEYGLVLIMTSNYPPQGLYPDGLQRNSFLPAIELILQQNYVFNVDFGIDYRQRTLTKIPIYHLIETTEILESNKTVNEKLNEAFDELNPTENEYTPALITIENRQISAKRYAESVIWFDFKTLCGGPRSQNDYIELAQQFNTIILSDIPKLSAGDASSARRFTWFIDVCYDFSVKVIFSAYVIPEKIYTQGQLANEFHRTVSRITEMQSLEYLALEKRYEKKL
jgi:cell division protein ZapE